MNELHVLFQHLLAHVCSSGGIVLLLVLAGGVKHRAPSGRRRRVCLEGRFASGVSFLRRADGTDTSIVHLHLQPTPGIPFFIRGKNPTDNVASNYISTAVDPAFRDFAWMIAKHESREGTRMYNQFNPGTGLTEQPFKGNDTRDQAGNVVNNYGWGMCQIDKGSTGLVTRAVYDWKENVLMMNGKLREADANFNRFLGYFRAEYQTDPRWREPGQASTNLNGRVVSLRESTVYKGLHRVGI